MYLKSRINLDSNASFGVTQRVAESVCQYLGQERLANPSSIYSSGQEARAIIEASRLNIAKLIGEPDLRRIDVIFTSGATEANNLALRSPFILEEVCKGHEAVVSAVEHPSVTAVAGALQARGVDVTYIYPASNTFTPSRVLSQMTAATRIVTIMSANNETGHVYPISSIAKELKASFPDAFFHVDATQSIGKSSFNFWECGADTVAISGHKFGALPGVGALILKKHLPLNPLILGGPQEVRRRAGTENLLGIFSMGLAAEETIRTLAERIKQMQTNRLILEQVLRECPGAQFISQGDGLPNTISLKISGIRAADLVVALDMQGVEVSHGSACTSGKQDHSPVLTALGMSVEAAREVIRISLRGTEGNFELIRAGQIIIETVTQMKRGTGV